jgi:hypothetical protein
MYYLLIFQEDGTEHVFTTRTDSFACEEAGAAWIKLYPRDIVMVVEEDA